MIANNGSSAIKKWDVFQYDSGGRRSRNRLNEGRKGVTDSNAVSNRVASLSLVQTDEGLMPYALYNSGYWRMAQEAQLSVQRALDILSDALIMDGDAYDRYQNLKLLDEIGQIQSKDDEDFVSDQVIANARMFVANVRKQPMIFKTHRNSVQFEYELEDGSYLEFELYEERLTCMEIPCADVSKAFFPDVSYDDSGIINKIIEDFINGRTK